jgi:DNA-binding response OmpR family regulator
MTRQARIALVEDEDDIRLSVEDYLTHAGYRVWGVGSAEDFYRRFAAEPVDVVVLDIGLPGEDGLGVAELLKANPSVAVIILSARDALDERLSGLRAGADRYLVKPVNLEELTANIEVVVRRLGTHPEQPMLDLPRPVQQQSSRSWSLNTQGWVLMAPSGKALKLTAREFALLYRLISLNGQAVPKKQLGDEIFGQRVANSADRLNVLVTRLRKKATEELGEPLPVKTAHQIGYAFTANALLA